MPKGAENCRDGHYSTNKKLGSGSGGEAETAESPYTNKDVPSWTAPTSGRWQNRGYGDGRRNVPLQVEMNPQKRGRGDTNKVAIDRSNVSAANQRHAISATKNVVGSQT